MINAKKVKINNKIALKAAQKITPNDEVTIIEKDHPYVSRSALKLKGLLEKTNLNFNEKIVLDIGSSTGGFTQIALEYGAKKVYAVDVGTNQLAKELRSNKNITILENTDARELNGENLTPPPEVLIADISFISLQKVLPCIFKNITTLKTLCILVKPQFELNKSAISKGGIVKNEKDRLRALSDVEDCVETYGFKVCYDMEAALTGSDGNIEYMIHAQKAILT